MKRVVSLQLNSAGYRMICRSGVSSVNWALGGRQALSVRMAATIIVVVIAASRVGHAEDLTSQLFDGHTLHGWTNLDGGPVSDGWEVVDGMIHLKSLRERSGAIVTEREFGDMDLSFDWKIAPNGNSGLKYRVRKYGDRTLGCEYQIFDDTSRREQISPRQSAGALYGLYEPNTNKHLQPAGQFNTARIVIRGDDVQHWLNGKLVVAATIGSEEWKKRIADSKFNEYDGFALNRRGKIMLTDHGSQVWYRNFKLLSPAATELNQTH